MTNEPPDRESGSAERDLVSRLSDEYKILQDKVDKIGSFRFTIKGWSITVIIASIFAGSATQKVPTWLWAVSLTLFLVVFFLFERQQTNLRYRFGQRLIDIEGVLSRLLRNAAKESGNEAVSSSLVVLHFVPGIGHHLRERRARRPRRRTVWRSFFEADIAFYFAQFVVVIAFVCWHGSTPPRTQGNFGIVINAFPSNGAASKKVDQLRSVEPSLTTKRNMHSAGRNANTTKKKEEH